MSSGPTSSSATRQCLRLDGSTTAGRVSDFGSGVGRGAEASYNFGCRTLGRRWLDDPPLVACPSRVPCGRFRCRVDCDVPVLEAPPLERVADRVEVGGVIRAELNVQMDGTELTFAIEGSRDLAIADPDRVADGMCAMLSAAAEAALAVMARGTR